MINLTLAQMPVGQLHLWFLPFGWKDVLDIAVTAIIVYQIYRLIRGTIAVQIAFALLGFYALNVMVRAAGMTTLKTLFGAVGDVFVLAVLIIFAPEIRQALFLVGRNPIVRRFVSPPPREHIIDEIVAAVTEMSQDRIGSIIAIGRGTGLRNYIDTGSKLNADVESSLLKSIFYPNSPLHDGAVVVQGNKIEAARCILPVTDSRDLDPHLGLRHRAAIGLTDRSDAFVVVTSEETGRISVAEDGRIDVGVPPDELKIRLLQALSPDSLAAVPAPEPSA